MRCGHHPGIVPRIQDVPFRLDDTCRRNRAGASALIGVKQTPLPIGFLGLALLLGALVWVWRREGGGATR